MEVPSASAGDIVAITGIERPRISDTVCDPEHVEALPALVVDEPTVSMTFEANTSPFSGQDGKFVTSRQIRERLMQEALHNVAMRIEETENPDKLRVSGRGELHLSILLENMRREGYEIAVSRPRVVTKMIEGRLNEPFEMLAVDVEEKSQGAVMEALGSRGASLTDMRPDGKGRVRLDYVVPTRGLIGFQTTFRTITSGSGIMHHVFDHYGPAKASDLTQRPNGAMVSMATGKALGLRAVQSAGARHAVHRAGRSDLRRSGRGAPHAQ